NNVLKWSGADGGTSYTGSYNIKYGLYGTFNASTKTIWTNVKFLQGGSSAPWSGYFEVQDQNSLKAANVSGAALTNGAPVILWPFGSTHKNDEWQFVATDSGYYHLLNR